MQGRGHRDQCHTAVATAAATTAAATTAAATTAAATTAATATTAAATTAATATTAAATTPTATAAPTSNPGSGINHGIHIGASTDRVRFLQYHQEVSSGKQETRVQHPLL